MIGILVAMDKEAELLIKELSDKKYEKVAIFDFYSGKINNKDLVVAVCGVGKVNAAACCQAMILKYNPDEIINIGSSGAIDKTLEIGDIVIGEKIVQHDLDATAYGVPLGYVFGLDTIHMDCNERFISKMLSISSSFQDLNFVKGVIATGDQFICNEIDQKRISEFEGIACEMEAGSIAQICMINKVPFAVLKAISDKADHSATIDFPKFLEKASENFTKVILKYIS